MTKSLTKLDFHVNENPKVIPTNLPTEVGGRDACASKNQPLEISLAGLQNQPACQVGSRSSL